MAKQLSPASVTREERTFRVERETPVDRNYRLRIHREVVMRADGEILGQPTQRLFAFDEPVSDALKRPAAAKYLAAINAAKSLPEVMAAEAQLYDDLVAEVDAEREAAKAAKAAEAQRLADEQAKAAKAAEAQRLADEQAKAAAAAVAADAAQTKEV